MKNFYESEEEGINLEEVKSAIEKIVNSPENKRIDLNYFRDVKKIIDGKEIYVFPVEMLKADIKEVGDKTRWIKKQKAQLSDKERNANAVAEFVEVAIPETIRKLKWLGDKIKVIRPSLYDDYFNGIDNVIQMLPDEIVENENDIKCIGFSIDFTISDEQAEKKMIDAILDIVSGKVPLMKYFNTDIKTKHGYKNIKIRDFQIPKIIMSCPHKILSESQDDLLNFEKNPNDIDIKNKAENTSLRYYFIRETLSQLKFFSALAEKVGNIAAKILYENALHSFEEMIENQGINESVLDKKVGKISGTVGKFDLEADDGKIIEIFKVMAAQNKKR